MEKDKMFGVFSKVKGTRVFYQVGLGSEETLAAIDKLNSQTYKIPEGRVIPVFQSTELKENEILLCNDGRFRMITPNGQIILAPGSLRK
jgi:hypothetical protein